MTKEEQLYKNTSEAEKPKRMKKCHQCKERSIPYGSMRTFCFKNECIEAHNKKTLAKKKRDAVATARNNDKSWLMDKCQKIAQKQGKLHSYLCGIHQCVTCGIELSTQKQIDGGHFLPKNNWSAIKLYTLQIHPQCVGCNSHNSGQRSEYKTFMINRYGLEKTEWLESFRGVTRKYTVEYLRKYKRVMSKRVRRQEKLLKERQQCNP